MIMTSMSELVEQGKQQGFLEFTYIEHVLKSELDLMPDQIIDLAAVLKDLGIEIRGLDFEHLPSDDG
jgi:Sigma-70 factor, region 1.1